MVTRATQASTAAAAPQQQQQQLLQDLRGKDVVMRFYEAYNERDLGTIAALIADDIAYHDLVYEEPHLGRAGVMDWLNKVRGPVFTRGGMVRGGGGGSPLYYRVCVCVGGGGSPLQDQRNKI